MIVLCCALCSSALIPMTTLGNRGLNVLHFTSEDTETKSLNNSSSVLPSGKWQNQDPCPVFLILGPSVLSSLPDGEIGDGVCQACAHHSKCKLYEASSVLS